MAYLDTRGSIAPTSRFASVVAFDGGPLLGDNIVRMVFLDEAGISNPGQEPFLVVGGIIVQADKQWQPLQRRLVKLANQYAPKDAPPNFSFHAQDLFHGGPFFTRDKYDRETRWSILEQIVKLPAEFDLPVLATYIERKETHFIGEYLDCFEGVLINVEAYMRLVPDRDEVASVIVEDNPEVRQHVRDVQAHMRDERNLLNLPAHERDKRWLTRIVGEPHFEGKGPSSLLQIADAVAFVVKRNAAGKPEMERFMAPLDSQFVHEYEAMTAAEREARS